ncbi:MAG: hypothetical protein WKG00_39270 [Polyangiaceae bacterium]
MRNLVIASGLVATLGLAVFAGVACSKSTDAATSQSGVTASTGNTATAAQPGSTSAPADTGAPMAVKLPQNLTIATNTQAEIDDVRIGCGNFWDADYTDPAGAKKKGITAMLWVYVKGDTSKDQKLRVHPGFKFTASKMDFEVTAVTDKTVDVKVTAAAGAAPAPAPKG